jgi:hypothetical protein
MAQRKSGDKMREELAELFGHDALGCLARGEPLPGDLDLEPYDLYKLAELHIAIEQSNNLFVLFKKLSQG